MVEMGSLGTPTLHIVQGVRLIRSLGRWNTATQDQLP